MNRITFKKKPTHSTRVGGAIGGLGYHRDQRNAPTPRTSRAIDLRHTDEILRGGYQDLCV